MLTDSIDLAPQVAIDNGHYRDAGMGYEQLRQNALRKGDTTAAARLALWASNCYHLAGKSLRSLTLLAEAFSANQAERGGSRIWNAHRQLFDFYRCFKPQWCRLQEQLGHMRRLREQDSQLPLSDLLRCEAVVARGQGNHHLAVQLLERAWQHHNPGKGLSLFIMAHNASWSALERGDREEAGYWAKRLKQCDQESEDARAGWWEMQIRLALWDGNAALLREGAERLLPHAHPSEQTVWWRRTAVLRVRCLLMDPVWGDPQDHTHPARQQLCWPAVARLEVDDKFHRAILMVDYRLACLRYAVGLSPVEDLYHQRSSPVRGQRLKPGVGPDDIHERIRRVRLAMDCATSIAQSFDAVYRCQWRQDVVNVRRRRLGAIKMALM